MNVWQISISRRSLTIAAVLVATVSLGLGAHEPIIGVRSPVSYCAAGAISLDSAVFLAGRAAPANTPST